jgi:hypothetical protein
MHRKLKLLTSPQDNEDDIIELNLVNNTTLKPGDAFSFEIWVFPKL